MWKKSEFIEGAFYRELKPNWYEIYEITEQKPFYHDKEYALAHGSLRYEDIDVTEVMEAFGCNEESELRNVFGGNWKEAAVLAWFDMTTKNGEYWITKPFGSYQEAFMVLCLIVPEIVKETEELEISSVLTLSSAHIKEETAKLLDKDATGLIVYPKEKYGWFILTCNWEEYEETIPDDLKKCVAFAANKGCDLLCLDGDGPVIKDIPAYPWKN